MSINGTLAMNEYALSKHNNMCQNQARCKVVVNNGVKDSVKVENDIQPSGVVYGENPYGSSFPSVAPVMNRDGCNPEDRRSNVNLNSTTEPGNLEFYKLLSLTLATILRTNNPKLIANLIDQSGKIIVCVNDLIRLIGSLTGNDPLIIKVIFHSIEEVGCLGKISPIRNIKNIKIQNIDFHLGFNREYNILNDDFSICLDRVLVCS